MIAFHSCSDHDSYVHERDQRVRLILAVVVALVVSLGSHQVGAGLALIYAAGLFLLARIRLRYLAVRLGLLNALLLFLVLSLASRGQRDAELWRFAVNQAGLDAGTLMWLKVNAIFLLATALVATIDPARLAANLQCLFLPEKLVLLLFLTIRYSELLTQEFRRLRISMKVRGFHLTLRPHGLRSIGYLVGSLLVRSFDRSERVSAAMHCRAFRGRFYAAPHGKLRTADLLFMAPGIILVCVISYLELYGL